MSQFGSLHELAQITCAEWAEGIRQRLASDHTTIQGDAPARLLELGERHPRATTLVARAHMQAIEQLRHDIDHAIVAALDRALDAEQLRHQQ